MNKVNVVVSRYNKNVDFVYKIKDVNVLIYDKNNPQNQYNVPVNKGNEASVYLKYIVDHYDNLPDFTFFIHDDEYAWHHSGSIVDKYNEALLSKKLYYNINDKCIQTKQNAIKTEHGAELYNIFLSWYNQLIEPYIPFSKIPKDFMYNQRGSAQFLVHKQIIQKLPKVFYSNLYIWIITTNLPNFFSGRFLEWTWHIFWDVYPNIQ
jgi:hypothetical protein